MDNIACRIFLAVFAVYRVSNVIVREGGPFNVFGKLRGFLYTQYEASRLLELRSTGLWLTLSDLFTCVYCMGIWAAFLFAVIVYTSNRITDIVLLGFGLAGAQAFIQEIGDYLGGKLSRD